MRYKIYIGDSVVTIKKGYNLGNLVKEVYQCDNPDCPDKETPKTPPELPNTGAGGVIGIFSIVTVAGAVMHRKFLAKRA